MRLAEVRKKGILTFWRPEGKTQVTVRYVNGEPVSIPTVVIAAQHTPEVSYKEIKEAIVEEVIKEVVPAHLMTSDTEYLINTTGRFVVGGPLADCGVTGRKIIVDTYGGRGHHGGGAFSGKDPTKVDRTASYMARYIAKNIVAAGLADVCEIQLSYVIGYANPLSVYVNTHGTAKISENKISRIVQKLFPLTPKGMITHLKLTRPIYAETSHGGHFGRTGPNFTWEKTDMVQKLRKAARI